MLRIRRSSFCSTARTRAKRSMADRDAYEKTQRVASSTGRSARRTRQVLVIAPLDRAQKIDGEA